MTLPLNSRLSALYETDGVQKDFGFGFRVFYDPDNGGYGIEARIQTADGYEVIPKSDYIVMPIEDNTAGIVRFHIAPSAGQLIYLAGNTPTIQQLVLTNFGRFSAESIEDQFDFITAIIQEWISALSEEERQRIAGDDILRSELIAQWTADNNELKSYIESLVNALVGIDILPLTDKLIKTWSGGTQEEKNKENISAQDYGAKGDAAANDSDAFTDLELEHSGLHIDLLGKTYLVDAIPTGNIYYHGYFKVGTVTTTAKGQFQLFGKTTASPFNLRTAGQNYNVRGQMVRYTAGAASVVQSIAVDEVNRYIYTLTASNPKLICRYDMDRRIYNQSTLQGHDNFDGVLGHQGLAVEQIPDKDNIIWTSSNIAPNTGSKAHTFKFRADADGSIPLLESWVLFPLDDTSQSITPNISVDQRWLTVMRQTAGGGVWVRVFDMQTVRKARAAGQFDISNEFVSEFRWMDDSPPSEVSRQDIACDGHYIYVLWGTFRINTPDSIIVFDMVGNVVDKYDCHHIGLDNSIAAADGEQQHEPEGLCFVNSPKGGMTLWYQVAFGAAGSRSCWIYELGGEQPVSSYTQNLPAFFGQSANGLVLASPADEDLTIGQYSNTGGSIERLRIDSAGRLLKGITVNKPIGGNTCGLQWHAESTQSHAVFGRWATGSSQCARVLIFKGASGTPGVFTPSVPDGSILGVLEFMGADGDDGSTGAFISATVEGTTSNDSVPARLNLGTTNASGVSATRWSIDPVGHLYPAYNNTYSVGTPTNRCSVIYAATGTINTSDERLKQQFRSQTQREKEAALEIKNSIQLFKFNDAVDLKGDGARWHVGVKAQQVISILESHDLDPFEYAFVCFDEWGEQEEILDEDSKIIQEYRAAGNQYAIRYDELTMFILAAM